MMRKLPARTPGTSARPIPKPAFSTTSASQTMTIAAITWMTAICAAMMKPRIMRTSRPMK